MAQIKLTKMELRAQQYQLSSLAKYLPTLQLKKAMLQVEVDMAQAEIEALKEKLREKRRALAPSQSLLTHPSVPLLLQNIEIEEVKRRTENIAGAEIPLFGRAIFKEGDYSLFDAPLFIDTLTEGVRELVALREQIKVAQEKRTILAKELREVSIRVNLFEKILIPRARANIRKIKVFLGDQELSAISQAKVAKRKKISGSYSG